MTEAEILKLAFETLDRGLCFSRTAHITRATDAELVEFARVIIERCAATAEACGGTASAQAIRALK